MLRHIFCATAVIGLTACDEGEAVSNESATSATTPQEFAFAAASDSSILTLNGEVVSTTPQSFQLDIGNEAIMVEMDDWDWYGEGRALKPGDRVSVTGRVDQDLWETKKIEAESVFVKNLATRFYADGADEEDLATALTQVDAPATSALGMVSSIEGLEYTVGSASGPIRVDASKINPRPQIDVGDRIYAWGSLDLDPQERAELMASGIVVLTADKTKKAGASSSSPSPSDTVSNNSVSRNDASPANSSS